MNKVLVVGNAGYIGGALTDLINKLDQSSNVYMGYDSLCFQDYYLKDFPFYAGDIRDDAKLKYYLNWADTVVWLAAHVGDGACTINPAVSLQINTERVRFLANNFNGKIIFASSCSVYGKNDDLLTEQSEVNPLSLYAHSKVESEKILEHKNAVILRFGTLFGKGDNYSRIRLDLVANVLTKNAYFNGEMSVFGGDQYRPILHVRDAAYAVYGAIHGFIRAGTYNCAGPNVKLIDIAEEVKYQLPETKLNITDIPTEDFRNYKVDCTKLRQHMTFTAANSLKVGIAELIELFKDGRVKDINNPIYHNHNYFKEFRPFHDENFEVDAETEEQLNGLKLSSVI